MWNVNDLSVNCSAEALLYCKIEGLDGDEPGHDVQRNVQVLHCCKTITDFHCEGIISLKEMGELYQRLFALSLKMKGKKLPFIMNRINEMTINLDECRHI